MTSVHKPPGMSPSGEVSKSGNLGTEPPPQEDKADRKVVVEPGTTRVPGLSPQPISSQAKTGLASNPNSLFGTMAEHLGRSNDVSTHQLDRIWQQAVERYGAKTNPRTLMTQDGPHFGITKRARTGVDAAYPSGDQLRAIVQAYTGSSETPVSDLLAGLARGMKPKQALRLYVPLSGQLDQVADQAGDTRAVELKYAKIIEKNPLRVAAEVLHRAKAEQAEAQAKLPPGSSVPLVIETDAVKDLFPVWHGEEVDAEGLEKSVPVQLEDAKVAFVRGERAKAKTILSSLQLDAGGVEPDSRVAKEARALLAVLENPATLRDPQVAAGLGQVLSSAFKPSDRDAFMTHVQGAGLEDPNGLKGFAQAAELGRKAVTARLGRGQYNQVLHQHANIVAKLAMQLATMEVAQEKGSVAAGIMGGTVNAGKGYSLKASPDAKQAYQGLDVVFDAAGEQNSIEMPWLRAFLDDLHAQGVVDASPPLTAIFVDKDYRTTWRHEEHSVFHRGQKSGRTPHVKDVLDASLIGQSNFATFYLNEALPRKDTSAIVLGYDAGGKPFAYDQPAKFALEKVEETVARLVSELAAVEQKGEVSFVLDFLDEGQPPEERARRNVAEFRNWLQAVPASTFQGLEHPGQLEALSQALDEVGLGKDCEVWFGVARSLEDRDALLRSFGTTLGLLKLRTEQGDEAAVAALLAKGAGDQPAAGGPRVVAPTARVSLEARVGEMEYWAKTADFLQQLELDANWIGMSQVDRLPRDVGGSYRVRQEGGA